MRLVVAALVVVLAGGAAGCSCSERDHLAGSGDAAPADALRDGPLGDGRRDGPPARDGGVGFDGSVCEQPWFWELAPAPIHAARLANGAPPRLGVTEQLLVEVQLRSGSCEALADVALAFVPGNATDFAELAARVWTVAGPVPCTADAPIVSTVVTIPGRWQGNQRVVVSDAHAPAGGLLLTYERSACSSPPACQCYPGSPAGPGLEHAACLTDCSCAAGLSCIGAVGFAGPAWSCRRPCADDRDCDAYELCARDVADAAAYVCEPGAQCRQPDDCPPGFACVARADGLRTCVDERVAPAMAPCRCDGDCPPEQRCSVTAGGAPRCEVWCQDDADCPFADAGWLVCGTPAVCVPLE